jgi:hypothetical protein
MDPAIKILKIQILFPLSVYLTRYQCFNKRKYAHLGYFLHVLPTG